MTVATAGGPGLPEYARPPVVEVALTVRFDPVTGLNASTLGAFPDSAARAGIELPLVEEELPDEVALEEFGRNVPRPSFEIRFVDAPPPPRVLFTSRDGTRTVAVQRDAMTYSWRRKDGAYPRYSVLRAETVRLVEVLVGFLAEKGLPPLVPRQAEVTYVDDLTPPSGVWTATDLYATLSIWRPAQGSSLPPVEDMRLAQRHLLAGEDGLPVARLYLSHDSYSTGPAGGGTQPLLTLNYRGLLREPRLDRLFDQLDRGHEAIVTAFTDITTEPAQTAWGRTR